jgi:hypothetical protein
MRVRLEATLDAVVGLDQLEDITRGVWAVLDAAGGPVTLTVERVDTIDEMAKS